MELKQLISKLTIYQYMIILLVILALVSSFFYGFGAKALIPIIISVLTTIILDYFINYFKYKTFEFPQGALISGLLIGGILAQDLQWHIYVAAGIIAITSKHVIKFNQKHIFNPANFGILIVSAIFGAFHSWWISSPAIIALAFGIFIIWRLRGFDLALSFLFAYLLIKIIIGLFDGFELNRILQLLASSGVIYFFSMYMLIEPKTNPSGKKQRVIYGITIAVLLAAFSLVIPQHDIVLALAAGNFLVPVLNKWNL